MNDTKYGKVTRHMSYAPLVFLAVFIGALVLETIVPLTITEAPHNAFLGLLCLVLGPAIMLWAQGTRRSLYKDLGGAVCPPLAVGPYKYSRNPTYVGELILLIGFAWIANTLWIFIGALAIIATFTLYFIPREEVLMKEVCGEYFAEYARKVRMWL